MKKKTKLLLHEVDSLLWLVSCRVCEPNVVADEELYQYWEEIRLKLEDIRNDIEKQILG